MTSNARGNISVAVVFTWLMAACSANVSVAADSRQTRDKPLVDKIYPASPRERNAANGHQYQRIDIPMSWHAAKRLCEDLGGHLATATSREENTFIFEKFAKDHVCWLGATNEEKVEVWKWVTGEPFEFTNWFPGEPNNSGGVEYYLAMGNIESFYAGRQLIHYRYGSGWNDHADAGTYGGVPIIYPVCEWDSTPPEAANRLRPTPGGGVKELHRYLEELKAFRPDTSSTSTQRV